MPAQQRHRIVNLTRHEVLDPSLVGSPDVFSGFYDHPVAMGGLIHLLANEWSGDRILIIGNQADDEELDGAVETTGLRASQLYSPTTGGRRRYKHVSKDLREAMAENYEFSFMVDKTNSTRVTSSGSETIKSTRVSAERPDAFTMADLMEADNAPIVVLNEDKGEALRPEVFGYGPEAGLPAVVLNPSFTSGPDASTAPGQGLLAGALASLLSPSQTDAIRLPSYGGRWAMDRISVMPADLLDGASGITEISGGLRNKMADHPLLRDRFVFTRSW